MVIGLIEMEINPYLNSYMNTLEKSELIASIPHIERFVKSGILIHSFEVLDTVRRKTRRMIRTQVNAIG